MRTRAFTITEVMVVIAIIAVLAAILTPVLVSARESANEAVCTEHLHQLQLAISMYRTNEGKDGIYGTPDEMGLPEGDMGLPMALFHCTGVEVSHPGGEAAYLFLFPPKFQPNYLKKAWAVYTRRQQGSTVLIADMNHRNNPSQIYSPYVTFFSIGVRLDGQVFTQHKMGDWGNLNYWSSNN